jgi:hypothetical protein
MTHIAVLMNLIGANMKSPCITVATKSEEFKHLETRTGEVKLYIEKSRSEGKLENSAPLYILLEAK